MSFFRPTEEKEAADASQPPDRKSGTKSLTQPLRRWPWWVSFLVLLIANYFLINLVAPPQGNRVTVSYTFFKQQVEANNVAEISSRADMIQGTFKQEVTYPPDAADSAATVHEFSTVRPAFADPGLETLLNAHGVIINARPLDEPRNPLLTLLLSFGPTLLLIGGFLWLSRRAAARWAAALSAWARATPSATTRPTPPRRSRSPTWRASKRPRRSWSRSSIS